MRHFTQVVFRVFALGLATWASAGQVAFAQSKPTLAGPTLPRPTASRPKAMTARVAAIEAEPTDRNSRIGGPLQRLYSHASRPAITKDSLRASFPNLRLSRTGSSVLVRITAADVTALLPSLTSRGFVVIASRPDLHFVEGMLPVSQLAAGPAGVASLAPKGLLGVLPSLRPRVHVGSVTSEADYVLEAARARATRPKRLDGTGVRIGVMSDSYNALQGAANGIASGDLPAAGVQVLQDLTDETQLVEGSTGTDEGRAMLELVHDLAPGAPLAFSSVYFGEADFAQQVLNLADPSKGNCSVLTDDIAYFTEPMFQDGPIAQAINQVVASRNAVYFSAAGNQADQSYENTTPVFTQSIINTKSAYRLNFDNTNATTDATQRITLAANEDFYPVLQWSDPFYTRAGVKTDLDMYLIAVKNGVATTDTVASSNINNIYYQTPIELFDFTNTAATGTTAFDFVIVRRATTASPTRIKYINYGNAAVGPTEYLTSSSTISGHAAATSAFAVAAVRYADQRVPEYFTSKGGTLTYLFNSNGTALASPATRFKPDIASADGTSTTFFGQTFGSDGNLHFFGTSAAAPHAAAVAALLRQSETTLTPTQVYARLTATARDIAPAGVDNLTGPGLVDAFTAIYGPVVATTPPAIEDLEKAALPTSWSINSTRAGRVQVRTTDGPASGSYHLVLDAPVVYTGTDAVQSLNEATWFLTGVNASSLQLNFRERKFAGETDQAMPPSFTGSSNSDGIALSVDGGTTWYRIYNLTGANATTTYQTKSVNLTLAAAANGLTLGNDVRIKFQQYGGSTASASTATQQGRLFDDISLTAVNPAPVPLYTATPTVGCPGLVVAFADTSALRPTAWAWSFPGGNPATSTQRNPSVTYASAGHYGVTLTVTNAAGLQATRADTGVVFVYGRAPQVTASATRTSICPGGSTTFSSTVACCPSTFVWSFPGGSPASATTQNPGAVTYAAAGTYTATLTVRNDYGSVISTIPIEVTNGRAVPFAETFEGALTVPAGWSVINPDGTYAWIVRDTTISRSGARSRVLRAPFHFDDNVGEHDAVYTPALNLSGVSNPTLLFDLAYAPFGPSATTTYQDSLSVVIADACSGAILGKPYAKGANGGLPTATGRTSFFAPTSGADWRQERVDLSAYTGQRIVIQFVGRNGFGNSLYLDNVLVGNNLLALTSAASTVGLDVWPNPVPSGTSLNISLPAYSGAVSLRLVDNLGRTVWQEQVQQTGAALQRTVALPVATGLYNLLYLPATGTAAARRVVLH
jgi:PKD repeat protein